MARTRKSATQLRYKPKAHLAYCDASGVIEFGDWLPGGRLPIAAGPQDKLIELVSGACRHAYDGKTLLVPGIPEAEDQRAGLDALRCFREFNRARWVAEGLEV